MYLVWETWHKPQDVKFRFQREIERESLTTHSWQVQPMISKDLYSTASLQIALPSEVEELIQRWSTENVPDNSLYINPNDPTYGRVSHSHDTISPGLSESDHDKIVSMFQKRGKFELEFGNICNWKSKKLPPALHLRSPLKGIRGTLSTSASLS